MAMLRAALGRLAVRGLHTSAPAGAAAAAFINLNELEALAKPHLSAEAYGYYVSGAESEATLRDNEAAFVRWRLLPRVLVDVQHVDTRCTLLGRTLSSPVLVAPMAMQRLCHPLGEEAAAAAAAAAGVPYILSTMSTSSIQEVAAAAAAGAAGTAAGAADGAAGAAADLWFQIYVMKERSVTEAMIRQAEQLGYSAFVVTVDAPRLGKRDRDERNSFSLPPGLSLKNIEAIVAAHGRSQHEESEEGSELGRHFSNLFDRNLTWDFIPYLKSVTKLPILVKGILAPDDARRAVEAGVDGIIVSNHGGRQLDHSPATIDVLPAIARAVQGRVPLLVDGGIRRGTDVVKCLALGANAVCLGRPVLWALTIGGQEGVQQALDTLRLEIELAMALLGCRNIAEITSDYIIPPPGGELQLPLARL